MFPGKISDRRSHCKILLILISDRYVHKLLLLSKIINYLIITPLAYR
ncbi:hypothetical protein GXM_04651 [Nostoc sphaeroides CCNUC1]|uniref:Uncharacterized protein n=1 Tax=Nostoc sphaeroides CCNUC1 TaxID=2653204 RepID=A0A5P8W3T4_9NOSO|nr:hypothetical protein GXM_04651 [Nostoc sphaeroides CCNUC1]